MAEQQQQQIPQHLIDRIRAGRAALVVGSSIGTLAGMPSWKKVLERLREELEKRDQEGDKAAAEDVAALLKKGRLNNASGFLARQLGGVTCDRVVKESWKTPDPLPEAIKALGRVPIKAIWTTHPGDIVERALDAGAPSDWPPPRVASYEDAGEIDPRRRYVLKCLGDLAKPDSYVVVATSVRRALSSAAAYRKILQDLYKDGALVFIGFRHGDPDLHAMLDRVFGSFEPPQTNHYYVGSGLGPVDIEELAAEHQLTVIPLDGHKGDETAHQALATWLSDLAAACDKAGLTLAMARPADDDLEGWLSRLADDPADAEAQTAVALIEQQARDAKQSDRLVEVLLARVEGEHDGKKRAATLREVARLFEQEIGDLPRAFTALTAALREDPADEDTVVAAERLAQETDGWGELVKDLAEIVPQISDKTVAAGHWVRLGRWYHEQLRHDDYAIASLREALKLDGRRIDAREILEELYRKQQKWGELAEELAAHAEVETASEKRIDVLLSLGDLYETQLASTAKGIDAYERALGIDAMNPDALAALERLYRRGERWGKLAGVLEKRAERFDTTDPARAASYRKELASLRNEKLGDVEGAIGRYEAALKTNDHDLEALRALEKLYEKVGRADDYQRVLEKLAEAAPEGERAAMWRRLAAEVEDREGGAERAVKYYENVLAIEPGAVDAYRSLERLYRGAQDWNAIVGLYERHIGAVNVPAQRVELYVGLGKLYEHELRDPHRAIEAHVNAIDLAPDHRESLLALARLYKRVEQYDQAVVSLTKYAELEGVRGVDKWFEVGQLLAKELDDATTAEARFEKALELDPAYLPAMLALIDLYRKRQDWARATKTMLEAERHTQNRLEKVRLIYGAALLHEEFLEQPEQALDLYARVLALDPEHVEAAQRAVSLWLTPVAPGRERWSEAEPVLEMLARKVDPADKVEKARREALSGRAAEALGHGEKAAKHYRLAVEADPDSLEAAVGLAGLLYARKEWAEADKRYREVLARHRPSLPEGQVVEIWHRIGVSAKNRGEGRAAEDALRRALERDPGHRASLLQVIELAGGRGEWKAVVDCKRNLLDTADEEERFRLLDEIGDLNAQKLEDPVTALGAYLEALKVKPKSHVVLHKTLEIYTEQKQWRRAVETLARLAETEKDAARRAKYYYTAAVIARDEVKDVDEAVENFSKALDDAPTLSKAFEAVEKILGEKGDWKGLVRAYRKMIKRLGEKTSPETLLPLWQRLGEIAAEKLGDRETATTALEVAATLDPSNIQRHEQLATLYLQAGPEAADKAITELQILLRKFPDRLDLYRSLSKLYVDSNQPDKSYCLAAALVFLGQATEEEKQRYEAVKPKQFVLAKRRLTEELWQKSIIHPREDRALNAMFASLMASLAATTAQPHSALELNAKEQTDPEKDSHLVARLFRYAVHTLGISPTPELYLRPSGKDIRAANIVEKGVLVPAMLIGEPYVGNAAASSTTPRKGERDVAFDVGKKLAFFRPERYVYYALPTLAKLEAAFNAALAATGVANGVKDKEVDKLTAHLQATVPGPLLEQVALFARKLVAGKDRDSAVKSWVTATDLTANRVGLILANDLMSAARAVATEQGVQTTLGAKERLRELLAYAVSEEYFTVRRHLGLDSGGGT